MQAPAGKFFACVEEPPYKAPSLSAPQSVSSTVIEAEMLGVGGLWGQALADILGCRTENRMEPMTSVMSLGFCTNPGTKCL